MKKRIILFLFLIMAFPLISAIDINMNSNISQGETVIASLSGNFLDPITNDNIYFYRGYVRSSFDYDVSKIGDNYYIYFQTTNKAENNYSINISGVRYMVGSQVSSEQISKSFRIINETADFSVNPGFVITDGNFSIKVQNLQPLPITIKLETEVNSGSSEGIFGFLFSGKKVSQSINLSSGEIKDLYIQLEDIPETTIRTITLSTYNTEYNIPCYVIIETIIVPPIDYNITINQTNNLNQTGNESCSFFSKLFGTCNSTTTQNNTQKNKTVGNGTSSNKSQINNTFNNGTFNNGTLKNSSVDYEIVKVGNKTVAIKNGTILNGSATSKTCAQIKGYVCSVGEICKNTTVYAKDAKCCVSLCVKEEKANTKLIGWVIIAFVLIIILWFFVKKFKGMKNKKDPLLIKR